MKNKIIEWIGKVRNSLKGRKIKQGKIKDIRSFPEKLKYIQ